MPNILTEIATPERISSELERIPGVGRAFVDAPGNRIYLICDMPDPTIALDAAVDAALVRLGIETGTVEVHLSYPAPVITERRARFVEMRLDRSNAGVGVGIAVLEWAGERFEGTARGEAGLAGEIRTCAHATIRAIEAVLGGRVTLDLLGIKSIRIFDQEMISVILRSAELPDRRLVGVSLVHDDLHRSSALAVLNATNRLLGNYVTVPE